MFITKLIQAWPCGAQYIETPVWDYCSWEEKKDEEEECTPNNISSCWIMWWNRMWKQCHSQYDVWFSFGRMELHFISLARCETGRMKLFTGDGLGAVDKSNDHQDLRTSRLRTFSSGLIWIRLFAILTHVPLTTLKEITLLFLETVRLWL